MELDALKPDNVAGGTDTRSVAVPDAAGPEEGQTATGVDPILVDAVIFKPEFDPKLGLYCDIEIADSAALKARNPKKPYRAGRTLPRFLHAIPSAGPGALPGAWWSSRRPSPIRWSREAISPKRIAPVGRDRTDRADPALPVRRSAPDRDSQARAEVSLADSNMDLQTPTPGRGSTCGCSSDFPATSTATFGFRSSATTGGNSV